MASQWFLNNYINNENLTNPIASGNYTIYIPNNTPFFVDNIELRYNTTVLIEDVDYILILPYRDATRRVGKAVYSALLILEKYANYNLTLKYKPLDTQYRIDKNFLYNKIISEYLNVSILALDELSEGILDYPLIHGYVDYTEYLDEEFYLNKLSELITTISTVNTTNDNKIISKLNELIQININDLNLNSYLRKIGGNVDGYFKLNYTPINNKSIVTNDYINAKQTLINNQINIINNNLNNLVNKLSDTLDNNLTLVANPTNNKEIATVDYVINALSSLQNQQVEYPTGTILTVPISFNNNQFLTCNGSRINKVTYSNLYSIIGDKYDITPPVGYTKPWLNQNNFNTYTLPNTTNPTLLNNNILPPVVKTISGKDYILDELNGSILTNDKVIYTNCLYKEKLPAPEQITRPWEAQYDFNTVQSSDITSWLDSGNLPITAYGKIVIQTSDKVYLIGGLTPTGTTNEIYKADINLDGTLGPFALYSYFPIPIRQSTVVVLKSRVYLFGGYSGDLYYSTTSDIYYADIYPDGNLGNWILYGNLPISLGGISSIVTKNKIYLIGGWANSNSVGNVYSFNINPDETLSPIVNETNYPIALSFAPVIKINNKIYVIGGYQNNSNQSAIYSSIIANDGSLSPWMNEGSFPVSISSTSLAVTKNKIYLIGGYIGSSYSNKVYTALIDANGNIGTWTISQSIPSILGDSNLIITNSRIYLLGGWNGSSSINNIYSAPFNGGYNNYMSYFPDPNQFQIVYLSNTSIYRENNFIINLDNNSNITSTIIDTMPSSGSYKYNLNPIKVNKKYLSLSHYTYNTTTNEYELNNTVATLNLQSNNIDMDNIDIVPINTTSNYKDDMSNIFSQLSYIITNNYLYANNCIFDIRTTPYQQINLVERIDTYKIFKRLQTHPYIIQVKDRVYYFSTDFSSDNKVYMSYIDNKNYVTMPTLYNDYLSNLDIKLTETFVFVARDKIYMFFIKNNKLNIKYMNIYPNGDITDIYHFNDFDLLTIIPNTDSILSVMDGFITKKKLYLILKTISSNFDRKNEILTFNIDGGLSDYVNYIDIGSNNYHDLTLIDEDNKFYLPNIQAPQSMKNVIKI